MNRLLRFSEQHFNYSIPWTEDQLPLKAHLTEAQYHYNFPYNDEMACFNLDNHKNTISTNYFIGVDWLVENKVAIYIEPKINYNTQVDYLRLLFDSLEEPENYHHLKGLFWVDFNKPWITINQSDDKLSPFLLVQFLNLAKKIVRKGLRKCYYRKVDNFVNRVKGKVLVSQQIKQNILKNRVTHTICEYEEFGTDYFENRFLRYVLEFVEKIVHNSPLFFTREQKQQIKEIIQFCKPAFHSVTSLSIVPKIMPKPKQNPFYNEYEQALQIGQYILKRYSFNIDKLSESIRITPVFWIDMSKLFELYVFKKLREAYPFKGEVIYHKKFHYLEPDFILNSVSGEQIIVDAKYKLYYDENIKVDDIRQLSGYSRLKKIQEEFGYNSNETYKIIDCLIIYPDQKYGASLIDLNNKISEDAYVSFFRLSLKLPVI